MGGRLINEDASQDNAKMYSKLFKMISKALDNFTDDIYEDDFKKAIPKTQIPKTQEVEKAMETVETKEIEETPIEHYTEEIPEGYIEYEFKPQRYIPPRETLCIAQNDYVAEEVDNVVNVDERSVEILDEEEINRHYEELENDVLSPIEFDNDVEF